ncbi:MAG: hypothetical protein ACYDGN_16630 [Acidimicrobiales bacterium]
MTVSRPPGYRVRKVGTLVEPGSGSGSGSGAGAELGAEGADSGGAAASLPATEYHELPASEVVRSRAPLFGRWRAAAREAPALVAVAALGIVGTVGFGLAWASENGSSSAAPAVMTSARNLVIALTNFDPGTVRADFGQIQSDATGTFAKQAKRFFGTTIRKELALANAASRGTIDDLYIQSINGNHATVFAVVSQKYLNKNATAPVNDTLRLVMGLTDVNGTWKTSSVQVLQQPVAASATTPTKP